MLFPPDIRPLIYNYINTGDLIDSDDIPTYLENLELVKIGLNEESFEVKDQEIINLVELLGSARCETAIAAMPERMRDFARQLYCVENIHGYIDFIIENHDKLSTTQGVKEALQFCYKDPVGILKGHEIKYEPIENWLFTFAMTIEKAIKGKVLAYGLSKLANETGVKDSRIRFAGPQFLWRQRPFKENEITEISRVFSNKFASVSIDKFNSNEFRSQMYSTLLQRAFYTLSNYRLFEPLKDLVIHNLSDKGISCLYQKINTALSEFSGSSAATADYIKVQPNTLIYWQSVTEAGRIHKTKEVSARLRATKIKWDGESFVSRRSANKIYMIADGEWRSEDFEMLIRSGVDGIFYPDEIDELVSQIQPDKGITIDEIELPLAAEPAEPIQTKK